ncbi:MAG: hypothetical protein IJR65_08090 [Oscillospiraceae bacterium]|nr:hypothetical protein [Oscillospiraceae bacterium]
MKKQTITVIAAALLLIAFGVAVYAVTSADYGTQADPLVTKSYLDQVLRPELDRELQEALEAAEAQNQPASGDFERVTLKAGQTLRCGLGTELLLTAGTAKARGTLSDVTAGTALNSGAALTANHLYLTAGDDARLETGETAELLVYGTYSVEG